jgi:hypothetical protein
MTLRMPVIRRGSLARAHGVAVRLLAFGDARADAYRRAFSPKRASFKNR